MTLSAEQIAQRRSLIGASEVGVLLGCDPHKTALELFAGKVGLGEEQTGPHLGWGHDMEPAILANWARREGYTLEPSPGTLTTSRFPALGATPDAFALKSGLRFVPDAKNVQGFNASHWGPPGTDAAPLHYVAQIQVLIGVSEAAGYEVQETGFLVASIGGAPPEGWPIVYDADTFGTIHQLAEKFLRDHVQTGIPPEGWESDRGAADYVAKRWARATGELREPTPEALVLAQAVAALKSRAAVTEAELKAAEVKLKALIGEAAGIAGIARWSPVAEKREAVTDWRSVAKTLRRQVLAEHPEWQPILDASVQQATAEVVTRKGYRALRLDKAITQANQEAA